MKNNTIKIYIGLGVIAVLILVAIAVPSIKDDTVVEVSLGNRQALAQEFNDAFSQTAQPNGNIVDYPIVAEPSTIKLPSGTITNSWTYNGNTPGPEIRLTLGDTLRIPFTNNLPDETTVHFHGIRVPNAMDGVPGVNQNPIQSGESFVYEFTPKDAGTFWFHPHVRGSEQLERGLYGTIIVEDEYSQSLDQDNVIILDDWRLSAADTISEAFNNPHDVSHDGRWGDITVNNKVTELIEAQPGERVRLRLVNTANGRVFQPVFSQNVELVAVDGMSLAQRIPYEVMEVAPGNRIDIEFVATTDFTVIDTFFGRRNYLLEVKVSGDEVNSTLINYPDTIHIPNWDSPEVLSAQPDIEYVLDAAGGGMMGMMAFNWSINDDLYGEDVPLSLDHEEVSKVRFLNDSLRFHPMHLHGQFFKVIARNGKSVDEPYWRDTILVGGQETIDVMLMPRDKGEWAMHCHIQEHAEAGMMTTLLVQ